MKKKLSKKFLTKILMIFLIVQPILDIYILFNIDVVNFFGFSPSTIVRMVFIAFLLTTILLFIMKFKKTHWFFLVYGVIIIAYAIFHHLNALNFYSLVPGNFNYSLVSELFYIVRMLLPFCMMFITYYLPLDDIKFGKVIKWLIILISGSIVITNLLCISLGSYSKTTISGNIFTWLFKTDNNYYSLASKGFFNDPNRIAALSVLLTPMLYYCLFKKENICNKILVFIQLLGMYMIGTKVSTYGFIIITLVSFIIYIFFTFIKKELILSKKMIGYLVFIIFFSFGLLCFSPMNNRNLIDDKIYSDYNDDIDNKKQNNEEYIIKVEKLLSSYSFEIKNEDKIPLGYILLDDKDIVSSTGNKLIIKKDDSDKILLEFIKNNYENYNINPSFILKNYPYINDPYFWFGIMKLPINERMSFRNIEQRMLQRVKDVNNNEMDNYFGITFTRMGNIFDLERDFVSHYYTLGIIGLLVLISPYFILLLACGFVMLLNYKNKFTLKNVMLILGISISLCAAYFSGNVMDGLIVTIILGFVYGELINSIFCKKDRKNVDYKISILTPTYNDSETIIETLNSIKEQSYKNYELIIINDGSTDNTKEIVENYIKKNKLASKIKYIEQENQDQLNALLNGSKYINGDYVLVLHSDDLLSDVNTLQNVNNYFNENSCDAIIGDLEIIDGNNRNKGKQKVNKYCKRNFIKPLQLLWLGRNLYLDTAVFEKNIFLSQVKNNYLVWNGPFWLNLDSNPFTLNVKKVNFSLIKYRVFEENYINNEIGKLNVINGELRVVTSLMKYYDIPNYKLQYKIFRLFNKLHILSLYRLFYLNRETKNKNEVIDFVLEKRFGNDYHKYIYLESLHNFYQNKRERTVKLDLADSCIYYGKDMRLFNKKMVDKKLDKLYVNVFKEMSKGFNRIEVSGEDYIKANDLIRFLGINNDVEIIIRNKKIPKTIHYVWVGGKEKPSDIKRCMKTWKKHLKDYEIIEWNENNFDINSHPFVKAAYEAKKWAFVSDYIRAWAIYNYGGIYLDTDVLVLDDFDKMLNCEAFVGYENNDHPFTATFGAVKGHQLVKDMLDYYNHLDNYDFKFGDNNTISVSDLLVKKYGCELGNKEQILNNNIKVYKDNILCNPSKDSITIHIFTGTWLDSKKSIKYKIVKHFKLRLNNRTKANLYSKIFRK